jgi:hypothetical protein
LLHCVDIEPFEKYKFLDNGVLDVNKTSIKPVITKTFYPPPVRSATRTNRRRIRSKLSPNYMVAIFIGFVIFGPNSTEIDRWPKRKKLKERP